MPSKYAEKLAASRKSSSWVQFVRTLLLGAIGLSGYLAWVSISEGSVAGCGPETSCNSVLSSRWAYWFGVPVSLPALVTYAALFTTTFFINGKGPFAVKLTGVLSVMVAGAALWFTGLQVFVLKTFCPFCLSTHALGLTAVIVLFLCWDKQQPSPDNQSVHPASPGAPVFSRTAILGGIAGTAVLCLGQILNSSKTPEVTAVNDESIAVEAPAPGRTLSLHEGSFTLDLTELPLMGSLDAERVIVSIFDYTCIHCRHMHETLVQAQTALGDKLAIVSLVSPLNSDCNVTLQRINARTQAAHVDACDFARIGLAVWHTDREAGKKFDELVMEGEDTPALIWARQTAVDLIGPERLEAALNSPWVDQQILTNTSIYDANYQKYNRGSMPQVMIGSQLTFGNFRTLEEFYSKLEEEFGPGFVPVTE